jgi:hypothetical protein
MRLRIIVEDDDGNAIAETTRIIEEETVEGRKVLIHPTEDLVYLIMNQAENTL